MVPVLRVGVFLPLGGPVHEPVAAGQDGRPVEDLALGAAEGVEEGVVQRAGEGVLAVGGEAPVDDALLLGAACFRMPC